MKVINLKIKKKSEKKTDRARFRAGSASFSTYLTLITYLIKWIASPFTAWAASISDSPTVG